MGRQDPVETTMPMSKPVAEMRVARELLDAEAAINEALIKQSSLFTTMVIARRDTGASPSLGHDALLRLAKSQQALLTAGGDMARVHERMLSIGREVGIGIWDDCPDEKKSGALVEVETAEAA